MGDLEVDDALTVTMVRRAAAWLGGYSLPPARLGVQLARKWNAGRWRGLPPHRAGGRYYVFSKRPTRKRLAGRNRR